MVQNPKGIEDPKRPPVRVRKQMETLVYDNVVLFPGATAVFLNLDSWLGQDGKITSRFNEAATFRTERQAAAAAVMWAEHMPWVVLKVLQKGERK